jgi:type I restriction enzyme S subunit
LINGVSKVRIPVPALEEQERIVEVLDRFNALINDISIGLPAEIAARQKQYEHYRDRMFTFQ